MPAKKPMDSEEIYQIKVTLRGSKPPIWRRIQVSGDITLGQLHLVLQVVMNWLDYHLHEFDIAGKSYGNPEFDEPMFAPPPIDEDSVKLSELHLKRKAKFSYLYDFGDNWKHELLVEEVLQPEPGTHYPVCTAGKKAAPPEDCGGIPGYYAFLEAIADPKHPEHEELMEWLEDDFDPEAFDVEEINRRL